MLDENLFEPLGAEARQEFEEGDGSELKLEGGPAKMQAVHSSAALTVNVFNYWRGQGACAALLQALRLTADDVASIKFEVKCPIMEFPDRRVFKKDPNLDVIIALTTGGEVREVAIECKFTELYRPSGPKKKGLAPAYLHEEDLWTELPNCLELGRRLCPCDDYFAYLHAAQLLKHILGLKHGNGIAGFTLLYLWYDVPRSIEANRHREEIDEFSKIVAGDGVSFLSMTFQDVITQLSKHRERHERYVDYLIERYL